MKKQLILSFTIAWLMAGVMSAQEISPNYLDQFPVTEITFDEPVFDFGRIAQGEKVGHIFRFTNTGNEPLVLSNARGSCGCTVPSWPKEPIPPGGTGAIVVEFDTKAKMGMQTKMVTITANTDPPQSLLYVKGEIYDPAKTGDGGFVIHAEASPKKGSAEKVISGNISLYPNPTDGILWLKMEHTAGKAASIEVFNANGQLISKKEVATTGADPIRLDLTGNESGTCWLSVKVGDAKRVSLPFVMVK